MREALLFGRMADHPPFKPSLTSHLKYKSLKLTSHLKKLKFEINIPSENSILSHLKQNKRQQPPIRCFLSTKIEINLHLKTKFKPTSAGKHKFEMNLPCEN